MLNEASFPPFLCRRVADRTLIIKFEVASSLLLFVCCVFFCRHAPSLYRTRFIIFVPYTTSRIGRFDTIGMPWNLEVGTCQFTHRLPQRLNDRITATTKATTTINLRAIITTATNTATIPRLGRPSYWSVVGRSSSWIRFGQGNLRLERRHFYPPLLG
jgi:hypothetical protein